MKAIAKLLIPAALAAFTLQPALAQDVAADIDLAAPVTLEGTTRTIVYGVGTSWLKLESGGQARDVRLPGSRALMDLGLSAEVIGRGARVKVNGHQLMDKSCELACKAAAEELIVGDPARTYSVRTPTGG